MVKFTAILVMTAMLCSLTACGHDTADEVTDEFSVTSVEENSTEEETTEEITETDEVGGEDTDGEEISETESKTENEPSEKISADGSYVDAIEMFLDCTNNRDIKGMIKHSFPDKYIDAMYFVMELFGESIEETMNDIAGTSSETVRLSEIISEETLYDDDIEMFYEYYGSIQLISDYIDEIGKENIDLEKFDEWADTVDPESLPEPYFDLNDGRIVTCILEYEDEDGDTYTDEQAFTMFYIDGEGWKTDMSMMGYVKKSKQASINAMASTFMKAANTVLYDLDEMGVELPKKCIICSDSSKNYNVSDDFLSDFEKNMEHYFFDYKEFDYVIMIEGCCTYTACTEPENPKYVGTYPANKLYSADGELVTMDEKYTLDEIYQLCIDEIQK
ncbi:MAG: hypothetical protein NC205_06990 [Prevotella sp.]|nr:hypothetical protein [Alistipes senegalensis]MCM1358324.1 hypothetical protein [Prevotella sp.]MCM1473612.1 hypothetical protein [Muribaculaceae bacterium]